MKTLEYGYVVLFKYNYRNGYDIFCGSMPNNFQDQVYNIFYTFYH